MKLNNEILLDCVNHILNYNFNNIEYYNLFDDFILVTVSSFKTDIDFFGKKTVQIYKSEYLEFERLFKIKKIHTF